MDGFDSWDYAEFGSDLDLVGMDLTVAETAMPDLNLDLESANEYAFDRWADRNFNNASPSAAATAAASKPPADLEPSIETPAAPCAHCQQGGYQCKTIREGSYKGYCTSCVALRCECSLAVASLLQDPAKSAFPYNPWPLMGDHPEVIIDGTLLLPPSSAPAPPSASSGLGPLSPPGLPAFTGLASPLLKEPADPSAQPQASLALGKTGSRFSRESVKVLKNWLALHNRHPYPSSEDGEMLQRKTGLTKTQISNWLANARRRCKIAPPRAMPPGLQNWVQSSSSSSGGGRGGIDIPARRGLVLPTMENMDPLQRWQHSPPENEPASVADIARAVTATSSVSSGGDLASPFSQPCNDDGTARSEAWAGSSASSAATSASSGGTLASAYSHTTSRSSPMSMPMQGHRGRRRRRRRPAAPPKSPQAGGETGQPTADPRRATTGGPLKTFQCTFCTATFRTKHDWQRHEKSLHLSLERWVCAPHGPQAFSAEHCALACVFCGRANPDEAHVETHSYSACQEHSAGARTFYRKDHLRQHLRLVHGVKFVPWSMDPWKTMSADVRSRCGFCGLVLDTWAIRVDHLAEHFKAGSTMESWKGEWGFETVVLDMVENSIPPYLIYDEQTAPLPFEGTRLPAGTARNGYEAIKYELMFYADKMRDEKGRPPSDDELQTEACRIIFGAEGSSNVQRASWLQDLVVSSGQARSAAHLPSMDGELDHLRINGRDSIFDDDPLEAQLHEYVNARRFLGLAVMDGELQNEASNIIGRMEGLSANPTDDVVNFLLRLIHTSAGWLAGFRRRAALPPSDAALKNEAGRWRDPSACDNNRLEAELVRCVRNYRAAHGTAEELSDKDLQRMARMIVYNHDNEQNQTAADNQHWLEAFRRRHSSDEARAEVAAKGLPIAIMSGMKSEQSPQLANQRLLKNLGSSSPAGWGGVPVRGPQPVTGGSWRPVPAGGGPAGIEGACIDGPSRLRPAGHTVQVMFLRDANCYQRLLRELSGFVAATLSPNNPNRHVPTDEELQYRARCILFDDDGPWNQTAADNAEWLRRFKIDVGIPTGPTPLQGLPTGDAWNIKQGGTGFAPPYACPDRKKAPPQVCESPLRTQGRHRTSGLSATSPTATLPPGQILVPFRGDAHFFAADVATVNRYLRSFGTGRLPPPAAVFCSRELEEGLALFVTKEVTAGKETKTEAGAETQAGRFPSDESLRLKAKEILGTPADSTTAADDQVLLDRFKDLMWRRLGQDQPVLNIGVGDEWLGETAIANNEVASLATMAAAAGTRQRPPPRQGGQASRETEEKQWSWEPDDNALAAAPQTWRGGESCNIPTGNIDYSGMTHEEMADSMLGGGRDVMMLAGSGASMEFDFADLMAMPEGDAWLED